MSGNDFLGAFYEKTQKHYGFSWLEGVQTGQEFENPAASATTPSPDENSFHSFYCTKGAYITLNHAGKRAFRNPSEPLSASTVWGMKHHCRQIVIACKRLLPSAMA